MFFVHIVKTAWSYFFVPLCGVDVQGQSKVETSLITRVVIIRSTACRIQCNAIPSCCLVTWLFSLFSLKSFNPRSTYAKLASPCNGKGFNLLVVVGELMFKNLFTCVNFAVKTAQLNVFMQAYIKLQQHYLSGSNFKYSFTFSCLITPQVSITVV